MIANIFRKLNRNKDTRDSVNTIWRIVLIIFCVLCYYCRPLFMYPTFEGYIDDVKEKNFKVPSVRKFVHYQKVHDIVVVYNYNRTVYFDGSKCNASVFQKGQHIKGRYCDLLYFSRPEAVYAEIDGNVLPSYNYTLSQAISGWVNIVMVILCIVFKLLLVSYSYDAKRQDNKVVVRKPKDVIQDKYIRCYENYNVYCNGDTCVIEVLFENGNSMYGECYQIQEFSNRTDYAQIADDIRRNPKKYIDNKVAM